jgi:hypothetical protein
MLYEDLLKRDKLSLDLFWIKDKSLTDTDALPAPEVLATEIADDLEAVLEQFTTIAPQLAAHHAREFTRDSKPQPRSAVATRGQGTGLGEILKQFRLLLRRYTQARPRLLS